MIRRTLFALLALASPAAAKPAASLDPALKARALDVVACAQRSGVGMDARLVTIIDYGRASLEPRFWVVDIASGAVTVEELVAHGRNSGDNYATSFSNAPESRQSSLGLFTTAETYVGANGYSLRLDGHVPGVNDAARARAIVMHGAPYVDAAAGAKQGRLGRSWGCPALRSAVARGVIDTIKGGNFVYAHHPDSDWVAASPFGRCVTLAARSVGNPRGTR
jgi:L,D-transpeptidase catalytic domain